MMTLSTDPYYSKIRPQHLLLLFALMQLAMAFLTDGFGFSFDEAMWQYIGRNWFRHGLVPYTGGVDNKSPWIFAIFGISDRLFGVNFWFPRILGTVIQSIGLYYVYKSGNVIGGNKMGRIALILYGLSLLWRSTGGKYVDFTETYSVTFIIISFYYCLTSQKTGGFLMCGFLAGLAAAFRLTAMVVAPAFGIIAWKKSARALLGFCAGFMLATFFFWLILWFSGIGFRPFYIYGIADNFGAGSPTDHIWLWRMENFVEKFFYSELVLFYPALIAYFFLQKFPDALTLWLIAAFAGINIIGTYDRVHFKEILPSLCLINAFVINYLIDNGRLPRVPVFAVLWILFFPKVIEPFLGLKKLFVSRASTPADAYCQHPGDSPDVNVKKELGFWIRLNTTASEKVYIAGSSAEIQVYSERISPSSYFNATETSLAHESLKEDLQADKPAMVLIPRYTNYDKNISTDMRSFISNWVNRYYQFDSCQFGYEVYTIRGATNQWSDAKK